MQSTSPLITFPMPDNWEKTSSIISTQEIQKAYQRGITDGKAKHKQEQIDKCIANLQKAADVSEQLIEKVKSELKISFKKVLLKMDSDRYFETLLMVDCKVFVEDNFLKVYSLSSQLKSENNNGKFHIEFHFMPIKSLKDINKANLNADGYFLKYGKEPEKSTSRRA